MKVIYRGIRYCCEARKLMKLIFIQDGRNEHRILAGIYFVKLKMSG
jgi:hypothetical protein